MDEIESVSRRDAVAGLGVLGALMITLVGTIFYRIVNPTPPAKVSLEGMTIAADTEDAAAGETAQPLASQLPEATAEAAVHRDGEVSAATFAEEPATTEVEPRVSPPLFAPSGR